MNFDTKTIQEQYLPALLKKKLTAGEYSFNGGALTKLVINLSSDKLVDKVVNIWSSDMTDETYWLGRTDDISVSGSVTLWCVGRGVFEIQNFDLKYIWKDQIDPNPDAANAANHPNLADRIEGSVLPALDRMTGASFGIEVSWRNTHKMEKDKKSATHLKGMTITPGKMQVGSPDVRR